jgi:hypothetical protein
VFKEMVNRDTGSTDCTAKTKTPAPPPKKAGQQQLVEKSALYGKILHILWTRTFPNTVGAATNTLLYLMGWTSPVTFISKSMLWL